MAEIMTKLIISDREIRKLLEIDEFDFPRYTTQIINLASQNAQATRPRVVGQMSELIKEFPGRAYEDWQKWYLEHYPDAIKSAATKIKDMIGKLKSAMDKIDDELIDLWVRDLVLVKTFTGMRFHEAILRRVSEHFGKSYRKSTPEEESRGIDGYIGDKPVSIKPDTYISKKGLSESLPENIIYYSKLKNKIVISFDFSL